MGNQQPSDYKSLHSMYYCYIRHWTVMIMQRKILKLLYLLFSNGNNLRNVKRFLKEKHNIEMTENAIRQLKKKYCIPKKDRREKYTSYQKRIMLKLYKDFYSTEKLCLYLKKRFGIEITEMALTNFSFAHGVKKSISKQSFCGKTDYLQQKQIVKDYSENNLTTTQLQKKYNYKTRKTITDIVKKFGKTPRTSAETKNISKTYYGFSMKKIDSELKAYYLGLLLTDGWVSNNRVFLDLTDEDVMTFLSKKINVNLINRKRGHYKRAYRFSITYPNIMEDVERYGLVKNKTHILSSPKFTEEEKMFLPMFLRGVIDGDGWISKDGKKFFISSASKEFITYCKNTLENCFQMKDLNLHCKDDFYVLRSHKQENIKILKDKIYVTPFGMNRKFNRLYGIVEGSESII